MMNKIYIYHSGILNMKWGERKYQNPDGTWTEAGKARRRAQYKKIARNVNNKKSSEIDEHIKTKDEIRIERQENLETAEYEAKMAEYNRRKIEANTKIKELTASNNPVKAVGGFMGKVFSSGIQTMVNSTANKIGEVFVKKTFSGKVSDK